VPEITIWFWIIKILCTTVGETLSDAVNNDVGLGLTLTGVVMGALLLVALGYQFHQRRYVPWVYWLVVVLVSIVGTILTDKLHDDMGIALSTLTFVFAAALVVIFAAWFALERSLSIRTIYTRRREAFYWVAVLATFALGTAAGDWLLETLQSSMGSLRGGLVASGLLFAGVILAAWLAHRYLKLNGVAAFWIAYVATRPFGANLGDFLGGPNLVDDTGAPGVGGLDLGPEVVSAVFLAAIVAIIWYLTVTRKDAIEAREGAEAQGVVGPSKG